MTETTYQREALDEIMNSSDLAKRLARIYSRILAMDAQEDQGNGVLSKTLSPAPTARIGQMQELTDRGAENEDRD